MKFYNDKLQHYRRQSGLSIKSLTEKVGINRSNIWYWENGKHTPSEKNVRAICKILNIKSSDISDLTDEKPMSDYISTNYNLPWNNFADTRAKQLLQQQENAIKLINSTNEELSRSISLITAIIKGIDFILYVKDYNNKYILANDAFKRNVSLLDDEHVFGKEDRDIFLQEEADKNSEEDRLILLQRKSVINEKRIIPGSTNKKPGTVFKYLFYDSNNKVAGVVGIFFDRFSRK